MTIIGVRLNCQKLDLTQVRALRTVVRPYYVGQFRVYDCWRSSGTTVIIEHVTDRQALLGAIASQCHEVYDRIISWMSHSCDDYVVGRPLVGV